MIDTEPERVAQHRCRTVRAVAAQMRLGAQPARLGIRHARRGDDERARDVRCIAVHRCAAIDQYDLALLERLAAFEATADVRYRRTERLRLEWPWGAEPAPAYDLDSGTPRPVVAVGRLVLLDFPLLITRFISQVARTPL